MGVLDAGAIGAAGGAALGGPAGALIGGGLGVVGSLLGGLFGSSAQSSANKANLQIARERNELQEKLFNQQIAENWKMFDATNEWNSAAQQRQRLEQAGYNPAALFSQNGASMASALPAPGAPNLATAQVQPVDALAHGVSNAVGSGAQIMNMLSSARKADQEAYQLQIDNITRGALNKKQLEIAGDEASIKALEAAEKEQTYNDRVTGAHAETLVKQETYENLKSEKALKEAQKAVAESQLDLNEQEKQRLVAATALLYEQGKTEITAQDLNKAMGEKALSEAKAAKAAAWYNYYVGPSVRESNQAQAQYYREQSESYRIENDLRRRYGNAEKIIGLARDISQMNVNTATIDELRAAAKKHGVDASRGQLELLQNGLKASTGLGFVSSMYGDLWPLMYMGSMFK